MSNRRINQSAIAPSAPIDTNNARFLIVKENKLTEYLTQIA